MYHNQIINTRAINNFTHSVLKVREAKGLRYLLWLRPPFYAVSSIWSEWSQPCFTHLAKVCIRANSTNCAVRKLDSSDYHHMMQQICNFSLGITSVRQNDIKCICLVTDICNKYSVASSVNELLNKCQYM